MNSRSGLKKWLFTGLALLSGAGTVHGQAGSPYFTGAAYGGAPGAAVPGYPAAAMQGPGMYGMEQGSMGHGPMSIAMPGPPPMEVAYGSQPGFQAGMGPSDSPMGPSCGCCAGSSACDAGGYGCDSMGDCYGLGGGYGLGDGGGPGGCRICGNLGGRLGCAPIRDLFRSSGIGADRMGTDGCMACGWGNNALMSGRFLGLLGKLAPFSEGPQAQRWFDVHLGTMALARTDSSPNRIISTTGINGPAALRTNAPNIDELAFGLAATGCLQVGPGGNLEFTYFGLNKWHSTATVESGQANLFSVFSNFGLAPPGGFDDTDRSISHSLTYDSEIHNAEINFRRRWVAPARYVQGSLLAGVRYFDLDETFGFQSVGVFNNGVNNTLRFFNLDTATRNQLTGFQIGSDTWLTIVPGFLIGVEGKTGVYGNHAEVESTIRANSVNLARETRSDGETAYLSQLTASTVYRLSYSWAFRASYNYMRVDGVALAPRNFNATGLTPNVNGLVFGPARNSFIDVDGIARYSGFSLGAEYLW